MAVDVRVVRGDDEWEAFAAVFSTALGQPPPDDVVPYWRAALDEDRIFGAFADGGRMVATAADFTTDLALPGGAAVDVVAVTAVGTLPTHRRRGAADALMRHQLATARERGAAAAVLHASEATIYERWGYGVALEHVRRSIDTSRAVFRPRPDDGGHVAFLTGDEIREVLTAVHGATYRETPGEIGRPDATWDIRLFQSSSGEARRKTYVAHVDADGEPDGYLVYAFTGSWDDGVPAGKLAVVDSAATTPAAHLALWEWVVGIDLAATLTTGMLPDDDPVLFALRDRRRLRTDFRTDGLWVRPLDVGRLLGERRYLADGELTLHVDDPLYDDLAGGYRVSQSGGEVTVERVDAEPDLRLGVSELGALLLGSTPLTGLLRAGRVEARRREAVEIAQRMLPAARVAYCRTEF